VVIWGISANSHDAAITVVQDKEILFASQSERYSGVKNDAHLNSDIVNDAKRYGEPDIVVWYEKPWLKSLRQLRAGQGWVNNNIRSYLNRYNISTPFVTVGHHYGHAAGGYYTSPFEEAAVLVIDAIGEFDTTTIWHGKGTKLEKKFSIGYPHSLGLWYSAMTQRVGLKPNEEEYILMGMAAYGDPFKYASMILEDFFDSRYMLKLKHNLHRGCMWWRPELVSEQDKYDIAAATQFIYEICFHDLLDEAKKLTGSKNLVLGGGCSLNCVANSIAGRAEFGPRALGHRSLLADPRGNDIKDKVNAIKKRQKFRPFAPAILAEHAHEYFHMPTTESPYMQYTALCKRPLEFPAIIHADGTSRVQTVSRTDSPYFYEFLQEWYRETGCPMVLNTSLNIKGKPMVNNRNDAIEFEQKYGVKVL